jgi:hypothetical protein
MRSGGPLRLATLLWLVAGVAFAEAPGTSIRPMAKPAFFPPPPSGQSPLAAPIAAAEPVALPMTLRPRARPAGLLMPPPLGQTGSPQAEADAQAAAAPAPQTRGLFGFLRPSRRPEGMASPREAAAVRDRPSKRAAAPVKGSICGDPAIRGEPLAPIKGKVKGCGIADPVRVTAINGIRLSTGATVTCDTAHALKSWVSKAVEPVYGKGRVVELKVAASYACRPRNNQRGSRISEHGRGNAIDISGFVFSNGKEVSVLGGFDRKMRQAHKAACGIFGTTLGPGSDGFHEDHLHYDVARYRNGPYCR